MFSPKYAVLAAVGISLLMGAILISIQGAKTSTASVASASNAASNLEASFAIQSESAAPSSTSQQVIGTATLSLAAVAKVSSIDDVDNVRWSLVRSSGSTSGLYSSASGVDWKALRGVSRSGAFRFAAGSTWSFNAIFQEGVGYKQASGVLAGGQCALATVIRGAAMKAGLPTHAKPHRYAIPGFALADSVNIWWGRDDLTIQNPGSHSLTIAWNLTPAAVTVSILQ